MDAKTAYEIALSSVSSQVYEVRPGRFTFTFTLPEDPEWHESRPYPGRDAAQYARLGFIIRTAVELAEDGVAGVMNLESRLGRPLFSGRAVPIFKSLQRKAGILRSKSNGAKWREAMTRMHEGRRAKAVERRGDATDLPFWGWNNFRVIARPGTTFNNGTISAMSRPFPVNIQGYSAEAEAWLESFEKSEPNFHKAKRLRIGGELPAGWTEEMVSGWDDMGEI